MAKPLDPNSESTEDPAQEETGDDTPAMEDYGVGDDSTTANDPPPHPAPPGG